MGLIRYLQSAALCALLTPSLAWADVDLARNKAAAWLIKQQRGDGSWTTAGGMLGIQATSAALLALKHAGLAASPSFGAGGAWLANADADSVDSVARKAEGLVTAGHRAAAQREASRLYGLRARSNAATWGGYGASGVDHLDTALGLAALRLADADYLNKTKAAGGSTVLAAFCNLAAARVVVAPGRLAWPSAPAVTGQGTAQGRPSVVATALLTTELRAMALRASLASVNCGGTTYSFATIQAEAVAWLLDQQDTSDGGFGEQRTDGSKGPSQALVTAWVYRALISQAAPPQPQAANALRWLLAQQDGASGSWRGDALVTASVVAVLPAASGSQLVDADRDGVSDVVETHLGSNTAVADASSLLRAPTLAVNGVSATSFATNATVGQAFSHDLGGGTGYALASGTLPPGLSLDAVTGQIAGTPTQAGSYSFDFEASVAGVTQLLIGRIDVALAAGTTDGDVPIPWWALLALGASMIGTGWRHTRRQGRHGSGPQC